VKGRTFRAISRARKSAPFYGLHSNGRRERGAQKEVAEVLFEVEEVSAKKRGKKRFISNKHEGYRQLQMLCREHAQSAPFTVCFHRGMDTWHPR